MEAIVVETDEAIGNAIRRVLSTRKSLILILKIVSPPRRRDRFFRAMGRPIKPVEGRVVVAPL